MSRGPSPPDAALRRWLAASALAVVAAVPAAVVMPRDAAAASNAGVAGRDAGTAQGQADGPALREAWRREVWDSELAFARSMAERDHAAFVRHLDAEAIFFGRRLLRGRDAVAQGWKPFFDGAQAPFAWEPDQVEVLDSGGLALSTGPVRDPQGRVVARFNSIWRRQPDGSWRVLFDKGSPPDPAPAGP